MPSDNSEERWLWLAEAVATGEAVDWAEVEQRATDDDDRAVIQALRNVSDIACAHTSLPLRTGPAEESGLLPPDCEQWRHLHILERVAQGTFGVVYRARDEGLDREVALKLLSSRRGDTPGPGSATLHEARLLARVRHPNIVAVYGADAVDGRVGLWMEFVHGRTLEDVLSAQGPFGAREAAAIGIDLCHALAAVHGAGLLHRDLKCRNVMREEGGRIVLMDFGAGADVSSSHAGAQSGVAGTPAYLAPEVFEGGAPSVAGDIYSVGVLLFHLVSGSYPVDGCTQGDIRQAHVRRDRRRLRDVRPDLPDGFLRVVERALAHAPSERQQTAGVLADDLAACMGFHRAGSGLGSGINGAKSRLASPWPGRGSLPATVLVLLSSAAGAAFWWSTTARSPVREGQIAVRGVGGAMPLDASGGHSATYSIGAQFRVANDAGRAALLSGDRVKPGDRLFLTIDASIPVYAYVINQDEKGESYLLFPLPGQMPTNPLPAGRINRLPGGIGAQEFNWQVTSAGGREHFFVFASPQRVQQFEDSIAMLPTPQLDKPVVSAVLPKQAIGTLRGVGGLAKAEPTQAQAQPTWAGSVLTPPLLGTVETTRGLWARKIVFENPGK